MVNLNQPASPPSSPNPLTVFEEYEDNEDEYTQATKQRTFREMEKIKVRKGPRTQTAPGSRLPSSSSASSSSSNQVQMPSPKLPPAVD